ncbi:hypothetical protein AZZ62_000330, partial [Klebsiella variicola]
GRASFCWRTAAACGWKILPCVMRRCGPYIWSRVSVSRLTGLPWITI